MYCYAAAHFQKEAKLKMRQIRVVACVVGLMAVMVANVALAQAPPMPKPGPEQQRLHYFAGQWKSEGEMKASPYGPAGKFSSMDDAHMLGDFFLVTHSKGTGPMGPMTEEAIIGDDAKQKAYTYDAFNSMGQHEKSTGQVSGKTWTWTSDEEMGGKIAKAKFVLNEVSPTSYTYKLDMSTDNGKTWANMFEGKATKVK
jgi:hypothetical protein